MVKEILIKPLISEKMAKLSENMGKYGFIVHKRANKVEIKNEVEEMYGVSVESVNTLIMPSKKRMRYTKTGILQGKTKSIKKAIVTLVKGDTIDFFEDI